MMDYMSSYNDVTLLNTIASRLNVVFLNMCQVQESWLQVKQHLVQLRNET